MALNPDTTGETCPLAPSGSPSLKKGGDSTKDWIVEVLDLEALTDRGTIGLSIGS